MLSPEAEASRCLSGLNATLQSELPLTLQGAQELAGGWVPQTQGVIGRTGGEKAPVGAEGNRIEDGLGSIPAMICSGSETGSPSGTRGGRGEGLRRPQQDYHRPRQESGSS